MFRTLLAAAGGLALVGVTTASAQGISFNDQVRTSVPVNEQLVRDVLQALPADDPGVFTDASTAALAAGEELEQQLSAALTTAPADEDRSRVSGVLTHTQAALASLRMASNEANMDAARGRLDQARGEAIEGLDELRPYAEGLPASPVAEAPPPAPVVEARPAELPVAGSLDNPLIDLLPALGLGLLTTGLGLRWWSSLGSARRLEPQPRPLSIRRAR